MVVTPAGSSATDDFPRLNTVTLCPAATASQTEVSDIWPVPPTNRTLSATDLLLQISFIGIETDMDQHPVQDRVEHRQCCGICSKLIFPVRWCDALGLDVGNSEHKRLEPTTSA